MKILKIALSSLFAAVILLAGCQENERPEDMRLDEIGKPISITYDPQIENSLEDEYFGIKVAFYIPAGIEELKNRPMMFTLSTSRNRSVAGSMMPIIQEHKMIAVTPMEGNSIQFSNLLNAMIESEYIDPDQVYLAGFSAGGQDIFELATSHQDKVNGAILLEPSVFYSVVRQKDSKLSVCAICQEDIQAFFESESDKLNAAGIRTKVISVPVDVGHFGILSGQTIDQKKDCFDFVSGVE